MRYLSMLALLFGVWLSLPSEATAWWPHYHPNCRFNPYVYHRPPCYPTWGPGYYGPTGPGCEPVNGIGPPPFGPGCDKGCAHPGYTWPTNFRSPRDFFMRDVSKAPY
jgi:hypothetical protein